MLDFGKVFMTSTADGFKNYGNASFSTTISGGSLGAGAFVSATATTSLSNSNSITQVSTQYSGLESFWRTINGVFVGNYGGGNYQVQTFYYFTSTTLSVVTVVVNQTGGTITIPTITINCRAFLFQTPF